MVRAAPAADNIPGVSPRGQYTRDHHKGSGRALPDTAITPLHMRVAVVPGRTGSGPQLEGFPPAGVLLPLVGARTPLRSRRQRERVLYSSENSYILFNE